LSLEEASPEDWVERFKDRDEWPDERLRKLYDRPGWGIDGPLEDYFGIIAKKEIERRKNES